MATKIPQRIVVGVLGLPVRKDKKFYLTRRDAPGRKAWHNKWQVAGGGLEFGEIPEETLKREMMEELQVDVDIIHPQSIVKSQVWYGAEVDRKQDSQIILITYLVDIWNQTPHPEQDEETSEGGWFNLEQIKKLDSLPLTMDIVEQAYKICSQYALWNVLQ